MSNFIQLIASGILVGGLYALVALGIVIIYKATKVFNFAQGSILMFVTLISWTFIQTLQFPLWLSIILALVVGALAGLIIYYLTIRPLIGQPLISAVVMTLGLATLIESAGVIWWAGVLSRFPPLLPVGGIAIGDIIISEQYAAIFVAAMAVFALLVLFFRRTKTGLSMRAVAESHDTARASGIKVGNIFGWTWIIAAIIAGIGGILFATIRGVTLELAVVGLKAFPVLLLGGLESIPGCIVGGIALGILEMLAAGYLDTFTKGGMSDIMPFIMVIIVLLIRPSGLFGEDRIERI